MIKRQTGMVSLITALMVSILLILLATALTSLVAGTQEQASDSELTLRAYSAAEGGVEWAYYYFKTNGFTQDYTDCGPATDPNSVLSLDPNLYNFSSLGPSDSGNQLTCIKVTRHANDASGTLSYNGGNNDVRDLVVPNTGGNIASIKLSWIGPNDPTPNAVIVPGSALPGALNAAGMELTVVNYPVSAGNVDPTQIDIRNVLFLPTTGGASFTEPKVLGDCTGGAQYRCSATIAAKCSGTAPRNGANVCTGTTTATNASDVFIVQLRPKYLSTINQAVSYKLEFLDSSGVDIPIPINTVMVDATAQSGSFYRRVVAEIPENVPGVQFNYVLFGDQNICKNFSFHLEGGVYKKDAASGICPSTN